MATKKGASVHNRVPNGTYGNLNKIDAVFDFEGEAAGTEGLVMRLEAGTKIFGLKAFHDALGGSTTLKVGYRYVDSNDGAAVDNAFGSGATTAQGVIEYTGKPIRLEKPVYITVTNAGGASTGSITVVPEYEYMGPA